MDWLTVASRKRSSLRVFYITGLPLESKTELIQAIRSWLKTKEL
jgi:hypothetical protein